MNTNKMTARIAGFFYLIFIVTLIFSDMFGHFGFRDAAETINNILNHERLFRIGFLCALLSVVFFLLAAWALYVLIKPVNKNIALLFVLLNLGGGAVQCFSMLNLYAGLLVLSGAEYLKAFQADQLKAQAMLFVNLYKSGFIMAQIFYGAWTFPLGYLVFKSGFLPRILGILLMIDCFAILIWFFQFFLFPGYNVISYPCLVISAIAEFSLTLWLLIKGVKNQQLSAVMYS